MTAIVSPNPESSQGNESNSNRPNGLEKAILGLAKNANSRDDFLQSVLNLLAEKSGALYGAIQAEVKSNFLKFEFTPHQESKSTWQSLGDGVLLDTRYRREATAKFTKNSATPCCILSAPITIPGQGVLGAIVLIRPQQSQHSSKDLLASLVSASESIGKGFAGFLEPDAPPKATPKTAVSEAGILKLANASNVTEFAFTLTNSLKARIGCEQLSLGIVEGQQIKVVSVSGLEQFNRHSAGIRLIEQAMYEALDGQANASSQEAEDRGKSTSAQDRTHYLHQRWRTQTQAKITASIPLFHQQEIVAILGLRDGRENGLKADQLDKIKSAVEPFLSLLHLLKKSERNLLRHARESILRRGRRLIERKVVLLSLLAALILFSGWFICGKQEYSVAVPYTFDVSNRQILSAEFAGILDDNYVRAGQWVTQGQSLGRLDPSNLLAQEQDLQFELRTAQIEMSKALDLGQPAQVARAQIRRDTARSQLDVIRRRLERSEIVAPCDGFILSADLTARLGDTVAEGELLYEIGSEQDWLAKIEIDERHIHLIQQDQRGLLVPFAEPNTRLPFEVDRIEAAAKDQNGDRAITAVARITEPPSDWVKPGMRGIARIQVGKQPVWWIWTHKLVDQIRLGTWEMGP